MHPSAKGNDAGPNPADVSNALLAEQEDVLVLETSAERREGSIPSESTKSMQSGAVSGRAS